MSALLKPSIAQGLLATVAVASICTLVVLSVYVSHEYGLDENTTTDAGGDAFPFKKSKRKRKRAGGKARAGDFDLLGSNLTPYGADEYDPSNNTATLATVSGALADRVVEYLWAYTSQTTQQVQHTVVADNVTLQGTRNVTLNVIPVYQRSNRLEEDQKSYSAVWYPTTTDENGAIVAEPARTVPRSVQRASHHRGWPKPVSTASTPQAASERTSASSSLSLSEEARHEHIALRTAQALAPLRAATPASRTRAPSSTLTGLHPIQALQQAKRQAWKHQQLMPGEQTRVTRQRAREQERKRARHASRQSSSASRSGEASEVSEASEASEVSEASEYTADLLLSSSGQVLPYRRAVFHQSGQLLGTAVTQWAQQQTQTELQKAVWAEARGKTASSEGPGMGFRTDLPDFNLTFDQAMGSLAGEVISAVDVALCAFVFSEVAQDANKATLLANSLIHWMMAEGYGPNPAEPDQARRLGTFDGLRSFYNKNTLSFSDDDDSATGSYGRAVRAGDYLGPTNTWACVVLCRLCLKYGTLMPKFMLQGYLNAAFDAWYIERRDSFCPGTACTLENPTECYDDGKVAYTGFTARSLAYTPLDPIANLAAANLDAQGYLEGTLHANSNSLVARDQCLHYAALSLLERVYQTPHLRQHLPVEYETHRTLYRSLLAAVVTLMGPDGLWHEEVGGADACISEEQAAVAAEGHAELVAELQKGGDAVTVPPTLGYYYHRTEACGVDDAVVCGAPVVVEDQVLVYLSGCDASEDRRSRGLQWSVSAQQTTDANAPPYGCGSHLGGLPCDQASFPAAVRAHVFQGLRHDTHADGICVLTTAQAALAWQLFLDDLTVRQGATTESDPQLVDHVRRYNALVSTLSRLASLTDAGLSRGVPASFRTFAAYDDPDLRQQHNTGIGFSYFQSSHAATAAWTALALRAASLRSEGATGATLKVLNPLLSDPSVSLEVTTLPNGQQLEVPTTWYTL